MSLYKKTLQEITNNKLLREEGRDISIPSPFSRMSSYWPGIQQGKYYLISAGQKVSK